MIIYRIGKITHITKNALTLESSYAGHHVYVARPAVWEEHRDAVRKVYIYEYQNEYLTACYGFSTFVERLLFEDLLTVNGIGPRTALNLLREGEALPMQLIAAGDVTALTNFPQLGHKSAQQIVLELQAKYVSFLSRSAPTSTPGKPALRAVQEIAPTLKTLGFNAHQIDYAVKNVTPDANLETMVEQAIQLIARAKFA